MIGKETEKTVPSMAVRTNPRGLSQRPELLSWVPLIPLQKLPVRFSPGGLEKKPHILGIFFLTYDSLYSIFDSS
jgi:hypothetical protein